VRDGAGCLGLGRAIGSRAAVGQGDEVQFCDGINVDTQNATLGQGLGASWDFFARHHVLAIAEQRAIAAARSLAIGTKLILATFKLALLMPAQAWGSNSTWAASSALNATLRVRCVIM
jgi:hypothetical protein